MIRKYVGLSQYLIMQNRESETNGAKAFFVEFVKLVLTKSTSVS